MRFIDTHCHLDVPEFDAVRDEVIRRAGDEGVVAIINVGTSLASSRASVRLAETYPGIFAAVGIDPSAVVTASLAEIRELERLARHEKVVAIGETGLDYHYGRETKEVQKVFFKAQCELAGTVGLPLIVHQRESRGDVTDILDAAPSSFPVVFHCFGGDEGLARYAEEHGYAISFTGIVSFPGARDVRAVAARFSGDRLFAETDAPYLSPVPLRGTRNEPSRVRYVVEHLARARGEELTACADRIFSASVNFFRLGLT